MYKQLFMNLDHCDQPRVGVVVVTWLVRTDRTARLGAVRTGSFQFGPKRPLEEKKVRTEKSVWTETTTRILALLPCSCSASHRLLFAGHRTFSLRLTGTGLKVTSTICWKTMPLWLQRWLCSRTEDLQARRWGGGGGGGEGVRRPPPPNLEKNAQKGSVFSRLHWAKVHNPQKKETPPTLSFKNPGLISVHVCVCVGGGGGGGGCYKEDCWDWFGFALFFVFFII